MSVVCCAMSQLRTVHKATKSFTTVHQELFQDLLQLSVSRYMEVRLCCCCFHVDESIEISVHNKAECGIMNKVTLRRAQLVLRWVSICNYTIMVCNRPLRPTRPLTLCGAGNEYWSRDSGSTLWLGSSK